MNLPPSLPFDLGLKESKDREEFVENLRRFNQNQIQLSTFMHRTRQIIVNMPVTWPRFLLMLKDNDEMLSAALAMPKKKRLAQEVPVFSSDNVQSIMPHLPYQSALNLAMTCRHLLRSVQPHILKALERTRAKYADVRISRNPDNIAYTFAIHTPNEEVVKLSLVAWQLLRVQIGKQLYAVTQIPPSRAIIMNRLPFRAYHTFINGDKLIDQLATTPTENLKMWLKIDRRHQRAIDLRVFVICPHLTDGKIGQTGETVRVSVGMTAHEFFSLE
jgi:hypothetical protein